MSNRKIDIKFLAKENIRKKPLRSISLISIIAIFVLFLFCGTILSSSISGGVNNLSNRLGADIIIVPEGYKANIESVLLKGEPSEFYLPNDTLEKIKKINKPVNIKIGISLSCTKCPKTVQATQRIATLNKNIEMEMINIFTFQDFKNRYDIMSVPAIIVDDQHIYFGEKTVEDMLEIINK